MLPCCQECSWVLISADCAAAPSSWVCWIGHDCLWVLKSACDRSLVQKNAHEEPWTSICIALWRHEHSWALMSGHEHSWLLRCNHKQSKALMSKVHPNNEHLWALMSTWEHSRYLGHKVLTAPECLQAQNVTFLSYLLIFKYLSLDFTK